MSEEEEDQQEEFLDDQQKEALREREEEQQKVRDMLKDFGVRTNAPEGEESVAKETPKIKGHPLAVLGEGFENAKYVEIEGLEDVENSEEKESPPLRRKGEGPFTDASNQKLEKDEPDSDDPWARVVQGLGAVRATEEHREIYEDIFFTDESLELPIKVSIGSGNNVRTVVVVCRTLSAYEREVGAQATSRGLKGNPLLETAPPQVIDEYFRRVDMLMCVKSVDGESWPCVSASPTPGKTAAEDPTVDVLVDMLHTKFSKVQGRKFALLSKALHIFEVINAILDDGEINGDFTDPVG